VLIQKVKSPNVSRGALNYTLAENVRNSGTSNGKDLIRVYAIVYVIDVVGDQLIITIRDPVH